MGWLCRLGGWVFGREGGGNGRGGWVSKVSESLSSQIVWLSRGVSCCAGWSCEVLREYGMHSITGYAGMLFLVGGR